MLIVLLYQIQKSSDYIAKSVDYKINSENDYNLSVSSYEVEGNCLETDIKELNERIHRIVARENEFVRK